LTAVEIEGKTYLAPHELSRDIARVAELWQKQADLYTDIIDSLDAGNENFRKFSELFDITVSRHNGQLPR